MGVTGVAQSYITTSLSHLIPLVVHYTLCDPTPVTKHPNTHVCNTYRLLLVVYKCV